MSKLRIVEGVSSSYVSPYGNGKGKGWLFVLRMALQTGSYKITRRRSHAFLFIFKHETFLNSALEFGHPDIRWSEEHCSYIGPLLVTRGTATSKRER